MATQTATGSGSSQNNGGTILGAGNFTSGAITNDHSLMENVPVDQGDTYGSKVPSTAGGSAATSGNLGTRSAVSAGTFAYNAPSNKFIVLGGNTTTTIGGVSNTILAGAAADIGGNKPRNPAYLNTTRRLDVAYYTLPSGTAVYGGSQGDESAYEDGAGGTGDDTAGGSDAIPGEFSAMVTGKVPTQFDYKPRTSN